VARFKAFSEKVDRLFRFENAAKQRVKEVRYFNKKPKRFSGKTAGLKETRRYCFGLATRRAASVSPSAAGDATTACLLALSTPSGANHGKGGKSI
jgi:hypothetical protein